MCGIAGKIYLDQNHSVHHAEIKAMTDVMVHRGPDDEGFYIHKNVGLGFRRLSIIDLSTGHQPLSNEDGSVWIIFNGEIYNFQELRTLLVNHGHDFRTRSDTEVIVHLYEQFGTSCLQYMRGMFSFAIYDLRNSMLFCARDRFGEKPFYYYLDQEQFIFGSEMKVIMQNRNINKTLNLNALDDYFAYGYILGAKTIYKEIHKLPPAHYLTVDLAKGHTLKIERYWKISFESNDLVSEKEWTERIVAALKESIKMQMISDVPLGAFLSGGIDSSSVVALMAQQSSERIKTFSIGFKEKEYNELEYAREVSIRYNTEHYEQIIEPESVSLLPKLVRAYDEPFADSSAIPTYYVSKFAREHVTVVLSGDGGDELFAGYNAYSRLNSIKRIQKMPDAINKMLFIPLYYSMPYSMRGKKVLFYASQPTRALGAYFTIWMNHERAKLFKPEIWNELKKSPSELQKELILSQSSSSDFISQLQELDIQTYLVDDILTKVDRASMMNSLEVRVPMLDFKFAELSYKIPSYLKLHRGDKKYIFKKAMEPYLPESILKHKKQGFAVPLKVWFRKDLNDFVHDMLLDKKSMISEFLNATEIKNVLNSNASGGRNLGPHIWSLLFLETWLNQANGKS